MGIGHWVWALGIGRTLRAPNPHQVWEEMHANDIPADEIRRSLGAQDGEGCCCNFLVYDKLTRKIPFWSHAVGANPETCDVRSSSGDGWGWGARRRACAAIVFCWGVGSTLVDQI